MVPSNYSSDAGHSDLPSAVSALQGLSEDLHSLRQGLVAQLSQEIEALMRRKQSLIQDIEILEQNLSQLRDSYDQGLDQQQQSRQETWARHLATALATHLQNHLELHAPRQQVGGTETLERVHQGLVDLDGALHRTLQTLQQELHSYQSSISQQVSRMYNLEQQGEAILEALVNRLSQELQTQLVQPLSAAVEVDRLTPKVTSGQPHAPLLADSIPVSQRVPGLQPSPWIALGLGLVAVLALTGHNLLVGLVANGGKWVGQLEIPSLLPLTLVNAAMLLWLRMVVVVPLIALLATGLHPTLRADLGALFKPTASPILIRVLTSGVFLGLSQILLYRAIADLGPGLAVTLLFTYPLLAIPLAWVSLRERPSPLRLVALFALAMGLVFAALPDLLGLTNRAGTNWDIAIALLAAAAFGLHWFTLQLSLPQLPPVPTTLVQFSTVFVFSSLILLVASFGHMGPSLPNNPIWLYGAGLALGLLTLVGYLGNHYSQRFSHRSSLPILAGAIPLLTAGLSYGLLPADQSVLQFIQWVGVILVSLGGVSLALDRRLISRHR